MEYGAAWRDLTWIAVFPSAETVDPPLRRRDLQFLATDTRTPYVAQFDPADAGKTAYYWLCWENNKDETLPWSAPLSATITG